MNIELIRSADETHLVIAGKLISAQEPTERIPEGKYRVVIDFSQTHLAFTPHIVGVDRRHEVRLCKYLDNENCIALGLDYADVLSRIRAAFGFDTAVDGNMAENPVDGEQCWIEVADGDERSVPVAEPEATAAEGDVQPS